MTRARSGKTVMRRRKRLLKLTKGFRLSRHNLIRQSRVTLIRQWHDDVVIDLRNRRSMTFVALGAGVDDVMLGQQVCALVSGGGYGSLNLGLDDNSGLYEGSIISTVAICVIPLALWLARHGTIYPRNWMVKQGIAESLPTQPAHFDFAVIGTTAFALLAWITSPPGILWPGASSSLPC